MAVQLYAAISKELPFRHLILRFGFNVRRVIDMSCHMFCMHTVIPVVEGAFLDKLPSFN